MSNGYYDYQDWELEKINAKIEQAKRQEQHIELPIGGSTSLITVVD